MKISLVYITLYIRYNTNKLSKFLINRSTYKDYMPGAELFAWLKLKTLDFASHNKILSQ